MLIELAVLLVASQLPCAAVAERKQPAIIVQVVDPQWVPVAGTQVEVKRRRRREIVQKATSDDEGMARFWIDPDAEYDIEVSQPGFQKARVQVGHPFATAHVQIRLKLGKTTDVVY